MGVLEQDIEKIIRYSQIDWKMFSGKRVLITGATGLLGRLLVRTLLACNVIYQTEMTLILPVRNAEKAEKIIAGQHGEEIRIMEMEFSELADLDAHADYVIHGAAPTRSAFFVAHPVETIDSILDGTRAVLEYARKQRCTSVVCLSSMEVFGQSKLALLQEEDLGSLSLTSARSSYPEAKRMAELVCYAFAKEYNVPVKVARLAQVFGPGVSQDDNRVFMQFCTAILRGDNIILRTTGETVINYCYTADAITGIIKLLLDGESGETYTVVNDDPAYTIRQIAEWLVDTYGKPEQKVCVITGSEGQYAPTNHSKLNNSKIRKLGWSAEYSVKDGYARLLSFLGEEYAQS